MRLLQIIALVLSIAISIPHSEAQDSRVDKRVIFNHSKATRFNLKRDVVTETENQQQGAVKKSSASGAEKSSPYVKLSGLYNDESIQLPIWFYEEVKPLNEQLKAKLSPSDYWEILKGEEELYGNFKTKIDYLTFLKNEKARNGCVNPYVDLLILKEKLEQIASHADDVNIFSRPHFLKKAKLGVFYREYIRYTFDNYNDFADEDYILSYRAGKSYGCSYIWTFWNSRTGRISTQFYCPTDVQENSICARKSSMGNIYLLGNALMEASGQRWNASKSGSYLVVPDKEVFQSCNYGDVDDAGLMGDTDEWQTSDGIISKISGKLPNYFNLSVSGRQLRTPWYRSADAGIAELYLLRTNNNENIKANEESEAYSVYENGVGGFDLIWDSLSIKPRIQRSDKLKEIESQIWKYLQPYKFATRLGNPVSDQCLGYSDERNFESFLQVDSVDDSAILYSAYNNENGESICGILGIFMEQESFLFSSMPREDGSGSELPYEGTIEKVSSIKKSKKATHIPSNYEFESMRPLWRKLKVHSTHNDEFLLEIVCNKEEDRVDYREEARLVQLNLREKTYKTIKHWEYFSTRLPSCWIPEKEWFLKPESDYQYSIIQSKDGGQERKIADFYVDPAQGYAIVLPDGRYAGSPGCESFLAYGDGKIVVDMGALAPWRNRPGEILEAIGGNKDDIAALKETTKRWLRKQGFDPENMPKEPKLSEFPVAEVVMPELFSKDETARFRVKIRATERDIRKVEVRADGVLIPQSWDGELEVAPGEEQEVEVEVPLSCGQNWIEVTPVDTTGISGEAFRFRTIYKGSKSSELYVVTLGVSDYDNDELKLHYAAKDARDLANAFDEVVTGDKHILTLTDKDVKDRSILDRVKEFLARAKVDDRVILYVAGHGMLDDKLNYYYAPAGFDVERIAQTGIPMEELTACLQNTQARRRLLLLDTCHSGVLGEEGEDKLAASGAQLPHGVRTIQSRGMKVKKVETLLNIAQKKRYIEDMFSRGSTERGINIIAGAAGAEYALESSSWNNGVFTASIMQALKDPKSDLNGDGKVSVEELQQIVAAKVDVLTGGAQKPSTVAAEGSEGFVIVQNAKVIIEYPHKPSTINDEETMEEDTQEETSEKDEELEYIIADLRATIYKTSVEKLYQKRLLQLFEMIQNGASVNTVLPNANGTTALHNACGLSRVDAVRWLIDNGADLDARTAKGASVEVCVGGANASTINKMLRDAKKKK